MDIFLDAQEILQDMENISVIESVCTTLDSIEDGMICESIGYGEVKKEMKEITSKGFVEPESDPDISKEWALLEAWANKQKGE